MANRKQLIKDLKKVDEKTDSVIDPNQYDFLGEFEFEDVIDNFGTWQQALDNAEISLKHKIAEDLMRLKQDVEGNLTQPEYSEEGKYPLSVIQREYGTWNKLKESLGLDIHQRNISDDELEKDMKRVAEMIDHPLTTKKYNKLGNYSPGVFILRDYTFSEFRDSIGLEKPRSGGYPSKEALKAWYNELKDVKGRFGANELKQKLSDTGYNYSSAYRKSLQDYLIERGFQFSVSSGGDGSKYYIKGPDAPSLEEYYEQFLEKIPEETEDWFMEMTGTGRSPKSIVAAIRYLTENNTQNKISDEEDVSEVSLRNTKNVIVDKFDINENFEGSSDPQEETNQFEKDELEALETVADIADMKVNELRSVLDITTHSNKSSKSEENKEEVNNGGSEDSDIRKKKDFIESLFANLNYEIKDSEKFGKFFNYNVVDGKSKIVVLADFNSNKTGKKPVEKLLDLNHETNATKSIVISTSFFKKEARDIAKNRNDLELWNIQDLMDKKPADSDIP